MREGLFLVIIIPAPSVYYVRYTRRGVYSSFTLSGRGFIVRILQFALSPRRPLVDLVKMFQKREFKFSFLGAIPLMNYDTFSNSCYGADIIFQMGARRPLLPAHGHINILKFRSLPGRPQAVLGFFTSHSALINQDFRYNLLRFQRRKALSFRWSIILSILPYPWL